MAFRFMHQRAAFFRMNAAPTLHPHKKKHVLGLRLLVNIVNTIVIDFLITCAYCRFGHINIMSYRR